MMIEEMNLKRGDKVLIQEPSGEWRMAQFLTHPFTNVYRFQWVSPRTHNIVQEYDFSVNGAYLAHSVYIDQESI